MCNFCRMFLIVLCRVGKRRIVNMILVYRSMKEREGGHTGTLHHRPAVILREVHGKGVCLIVFVPHLQHVLPHGLRPFYQDTVPFAGHDFKTNARNDRAHLFGALYHVCVSLCGWCDVVCWCQCGFSGVVWCKAWE